MKKFIVFCILFFASYNCVSTQKLENFQYRYLVLKPLVSVKSRENENFEDACPPGKARVRNYCLDVDWNAFNVPETQFQRSILIKNRGNLDFPCFAGKERISDGTCVPECPPGKVRLRDNCYDIDRSAFVRVFDKLNRILFPIKSRGNFDFPCTEGKERISDGTCVPECPPGKVRVGDDCSDIDKSAFVRVFDKPSRILFPIKSRGNFDSTCTAGKERISDGTCVPECPPGKVRVGDDCTDIDKSEFVRVFDKPSRILFPIKNRGNFDFPCTEGKERISDGTCVPECPPGQSRADDETCVDEE